MIRRAIVRHAAVLLLVLLLTAVMLSFWRGTGVHEVAVDPSVATAAVMLSEPAADDLPWWRGPRGTGVSHDATTRPYPIHWSSDDHVRWRASIPGAGHASPC